MTSELGIHDKTFLYKFILFYFNLGEEFEAYFNFFRFFLDG